MRTIKHLLAAFGVVSTLAQPQLGQAMEIKEIITPAGLKVWFLEDTSAPLISMSFAFGGGALYDPEGKEGLSFMLEGLLGEGAGTLDSQAFAAAMNDIGVHLDFSSSRDYFIGRFSAPVAFKDEAGELLHLALTEPRFDEAAIKRLQSQVKTRLRIDAKDPQWIAIRAMRDVLYEDHPYARRQRGTDASLDAMEADDFRAFVRSRFAKDNLTLGVSGDIRESELAAYVDALFAELPEHAQNQDFSPAELDNAGEVGVYDWPTPQTFIMASQGGISRDDPDYLTAYVVNHILGGSNLTTRLNKELREKRGWTYGVSSSFTLAQLAPLIQVAFSTQNEHAGEALAVMKQVWGSLAETGIGDDELQAAKDYIIGSYGLQRTSIRATARYLQGLQVSGLGRDYPDIRQGLIEAITAEDIQRVAKRLFNPDTLRVVAVGQPQGITSTLDLANQ